jgi:hypothetical protein
MALPPRECTGRRDTVEGRAKAFSSSAVIFVSTANESTTGDPVGLEKETIAFYTGLRALVVDERVLARLDGMTKEEIQHVTEVSNVLGGLTTG